jgi:D-alanine-D-alanine ligase
VESLTDENVAWTFVSPKGLEGGTLFVVPIDVPRDAAHASPAFRRDPEWLYGEGIGASRAPLVVLEYALRAAKSLKRLRGQPVGVLIYGDEGRDCVYSARTIRAAGKAAKRVLVLRPGGPNGEIYTSRRGLRKYRFTAEGKPQRLGQAAKRPDVLRWTWNKLEGLAGLSARKDRIAVSTVDVKSEHFPTLLPHRTSATVLLSYGATKRADDTEERMRILLGRDDYQWELEALSDRPPMLENPESKRLAKSLLDVAGKWELPAKIDSSALPSPGGIVEDRAVVCGLGPTTRDLYSPQEAVQRMSLIRRTLLLAELLVREDG